MVHFVQEVFGESSYETIEPDQFDVEAIPYEDVDGTKLQGYVQVLLLV